MVSRSFQPSLDGLGNEVCSNFSKRFGTAVCRLSEERRIFTLTAGACAGDTALPASSVPIRAKPHNMIIVSATAFM
jgi:hypothetical protein